jgi:iron complex outermembrane receptor protein
MRFVWVWVSVVCVAAAVPAVARAAADDTATTVEQVHVKAKKRLLKEKNSPSAVTELGQKQIKQEGVMGSTSTLLRQAPSVYVYQSGPGENSPVLSIRGTRGLEVAATLDDVPMQDLLNGGTTGYLGNRFTLDQIDGVTIYPGVAYPDKSTFGTIGGTVAYASKRSTDEFEIDLTGSVGSFDTYESTVEINSGRLDGPFGSGDNAPKLLLQYTNLQSGGYIAYTPARYNNFEFAFDKPYDDGLSKFQATVLFNTGNGTLLGEPTPTQLLDQNGRFSNYPTSALFEREQDEYLTMYIKDDTYISDEASAGFSAFYRNSDSSQEDYENPDVAYNGSPANVYPVVGVPYNFQYPDQFGIGPGFYDVPGYLAYDPARFYNNPATCPADLAGLGAAPGQANQSPCGLNAESYYTHTDSYGIQPHVTLFLPLNTIKLGGLIAKETSPTPTSYIWGTANIPSINGYNQFQPNGYDGGSQRTIYVGYAQDKIDLFANTLHLTPGVTLEGTYSSNKANYFAIVGNPTAAQPDGAVSYIPSYKFHAFDRDVLPFLNISYDLDQLWPAIAGTTLYASYGTSALFAPTNDFGPTAGGGVPFASIVHMYEGGIRYDTSKLLLSLDYFYQKVDRDFGYNAGSGLSQGTNVYGNNGEREFKGVETAVTWQVTPHWQVSANGSYLLAKYLKENPAFTTIGEDQYGLALKDEPISGVPAFLANFGADYDTKDMLLDGDAFSARFSGQFTGPQYSTYDLAYNPNLPPSYEEYPPYPQSVTQGDTVTDPNHMQHAFTVYNILLSYNLPLRGLPLKELKFILNLQNIFDEKYWQYYYSQIPPVNGEYYGSSYEDGLPGEPFSATFSVTARF